MHIFKHILLFAFVFMGLLNMVFAQAPEVEWDRTLGGDNYEYVRTIQKMSDGSYLVAGESASTVSGDKSQARGRYDFWVVKLDQSGNKIWDKTFGGTEDDRLTTMIPTADGGFMLAGTSSSNTSAEKSENSRGLSDYWIVKLNSDGSKAWDKTFGGDGTDQLRSIIQTYDGGYLLGGESYSGQTGDKSEGNLGEGDYWVVKVGNTGSREWDKTLGRESIYAYDNLGALIQTQEGGYLIAGHSHIIEPDQRRGTSAIYVVKLNSGGEPEWENTMPGGAIDYFKTIIPTADGNYLLGGTSYETNYGEVDPDLWLGKLKSNGSTEWSTTIGGDDHDEVSALIQTNDGGYLALSDSYSNQSGDKSENSRGGLDYWVVKINSHGTIEWDKTLGGTNTDNPGGLIKTADGGFLVRGYSRSDISGDKSENSHGGSDDFWLVKLDEVGDQLWDKTIGGGDYDYVEEVIQLEDGSFLLAGNSSSNVSGDKTESSRGRHDFWIVKLQSDEPAEEIFLSVFAGNDAEEDHTDGSFTLRLSSARDHDVTIYFSLSGTATIGDDYTDYDPVAVIPAGQTSVSVPVEVIADELEEGDETVVLTISGREDGILIDDEASSATILIIDNDLASLSVAVSNHAEEDDIHGSFVLTLSSPLNHAVTVNYSLSGTASEGEDYSSPGGTINIPAGQTNVHIPVNLIHDDLIEPDETVILKLLNTNNEDVQLENSGDEAELSITNNDLGIITAAVVQHAAEYNGEPGEFELSLDKVSDTDITITYSLAGLATQGDDYDDLSGQAVIPAGELSTKILVNAIDDHVPEGDETVILTLEQTDHPYVAVENISENQELYISDDDPYYLLSVKAGENAEEDDIPGSFIFELGNTFSSDVIVEYTLSGTAVEGEDYSITGGSVTIPAGESNYSLAIAVIADDLIEGSETVVLTLHDIISETPIQIDPGSGEAEILIYDNDEAAISVAAGNNAEEDETNGSFIISLSAPLFEDLIISYLLSGTAAEGEDYVSPGQEITLPAGQTNMEVPVKVIADNLTEEDETVELSLGSVNSEWVKFDEEKMTATLLVIDNDHEEVLLSVTAGNQAMEDVTNGSFTISSNAALDHAVTINFSISGTATQGEDYKTLSNEVVLSAGQTSMSVPVEVVSDELVEGDETVVLTLGTVDSEAVTLDEQKRSATIKIIDNDQEATPEPVLEASGDCLPDVTLSISNASNATEIIWYKDGQVVSTITPDVPGEGATVAGGNGEGSADNQLSSPHGLYVDGNGNIYVVDEKNHRVQKWAPGAASGVTVAGGNGEGSADNQLSIYSSINAGVHVDGNGNIYIADGNNHRVQKWAPGATRGTTVAGGNGRGSADNQLFYPSGLFVDDNGNIYVADGGNNRIQKWAPGATYGTTVAGGNGVGGAADQLDSPEGIYVDGNGNIYVADYYNHRVQQWAPGATRGTTVAGGNGEGAAANQLPFPRDVHGDGSGNIYITDGGNYRVQHWPVGATSGITVASNELSFPSGIFVDGNGYIYVADKGKHSVMKWGSPGINTSFTPTEAGVYTAAVTYSTETITTNAVTIKEAAEVRVNITADPSTIITAGTQVTFTADPVNGGENPHYQWKVNGNVVEGEKNASFTSSSLENGDVVTCELTSDVPCAEESTVTSNELEMTVDPASSLLSVQADSDAAEDDQAGSFILQLTAALQHDISVSFSISGTATAGTDYIETSSPISVPAGQTSVSIPVEVLADDEVEGNENIHLRITAVTGSDYVTIDQAAQEAQIQLIDNDQDEPEEILITVTAGNNAEEDHTHGSFHFNLSSALDHAVVINFSLTGTATSGTDYKGPVSPVSIPAGQTSIPLSVEVIADEVVEEDETVVLTITSVEGEGVTIDEDHKTATINILDNDQEGEDIFIAAIAGNDAAEDDQDGHFTLQLTEALDHDISISFTLSGTATAGADYVEPVLSVSIPAGQTSVPIPIEVIADEEEEGEETVALMLVSVDSENVTIDPQKQTAIINIIDNDTDEPTTIPLSIHAGSDAKEDDQEGSFTLQLGEALDHDISISWSLTGSASEGEDYVSPGQEAVLSAGQVSLNISIEAIADELVEDDESVVLTLGAVNSEAVTIDPQKNTATIKIIDNDETTNPPIANLLSVSAGDDAEEDERNGNFVLSLASPLDHAVKVHFSLAGTATAGGDYVEPTSPLSIPAGETHVPVPIAVMADELMEGEETIILTITSIEGEGVSIDEDKKTTTIRIIDNDHVEVLLSVQEGGDAEEGQTDGNFVFKLNSALPENITIHYSLSGTAEEGEDYVSPGQQVALIAGQTTVTIPIEAIADELVEGDETVVLTIISVGGEGVTIDEDQKTATIKIIDNDQEGEDIFIAVVAGIDAAEDDHDGHFTLQLTEALGHDISVSFTLSGTAIAGADYVEPVSPLKVPAGQASVDIPIEAIADDEEEGEESVVLTLVAVDNETIMIDREKETAGIKINDKAIVEPPTTLLSVHAAKDASEENESGSFTLQLAESQGQDIIISFSLAGSATEGEDYAAPGHEIILPAGQSAIEVAIEVIPDELVEGDETVVLTLNAVNLEHITIDPDAQEAQIHIIDNDEAAGTAFLPNLFSPNGDHRNDNFLLHARDVQSLHWRIFNQQGRLVYETKDFDEAMQTGWDGNVKGRPQPEGSYVWILKGSYHNGTPISMEGKTTGIVTLIR